MIILHLFVVARPTLEAKVEASHKEADTAMVEANIVIVAMVEVTLKAVAEAVAKAVAEAVVEAVVEAVAEAEVKGM